jgi:hypothetical protein
MEVSKNSLLNILRHAYLLGMNTANQHLKNYDEWEADREEAIASLVADEEKAGYTCYTDYYPCDCEKSIND